MRRARVMVNASRTGSIDKVVLEAMACGALPLTCNEAFVPLLGPELSARLTFRLGDPADLAAGVQRLLALPPGEAAALGARLARAGGRGPRPAAPRAAHGRHHGRPRVTDPGRAPPEGTDGDVEPQRERRPASGEGRSQIVDQVALRLGLLRGLSDFLARQIGADGVLRCPRHRVEHTGKNVYAAVIDLYNWRYTREEEYPRARAPRRPARGRQPGPRSREPGAGCSCRGAWTRATPAPTASTAARARTASRRCWRRRRPPSSPTDRERCEEALTRHVEGYLRHSAREPPDPRAAAVGRHRRRARGAPARAQRTGPPTRWPAAASRSPELAPDGVAPYIPLGSKDCTHPGLADTSTFYHSRTPGFVMYVHEVLGEPFSEAQRERLRAALDALVAMRDGNGRKVLHNEAKSWYWNGAYEVASHVFDVWALQHGAALLERPLYRSEAGRALEEWIAHIGPDGGVTSHYGRGIDFQCRIFWTAHAAWLARVIHDVPLHAAPRPALTLDLRASGLVHVERPRCVAVLRGRHQPAGNLFGCDRGGGALQSLVAFPDPRVMQGRELVARERFEPVPEGEFALRPAGAPGRLRRLRAVLRADKGELRFRLFVAKVEWDAHEWLTALLYPLRHGLVRSLQDASPWLASQRDLQTGQRVGGRRGGVHRRAGGSQRRALARRRHGAALHLPRGSGGAARQRDALGRARRAALPAAPRAGGASRWRARARRRGARGARCVSPRGAARWSWWSAGTIRWSSADARDVPAALDMGSPIPEGMVRVRAAGCRSRRAPPAVETT
jgi:hypothetical protein